MNEKTPICFVMHGLTGGSDMNYIKVLLQEAERNMFRGVCMNSRGIGI
jgi:predicted alpha/beta-fold hydrolase